MYHFLLTLVRNLPSFALGFPQIWYVLLSGWAQEFFVSSFQRFDYDVSWHGFLWVHHIWDLLSFLNLEVTFCQFRGIFSNFSLDLFSAPPCGLLLLRLQWHECGDICSSLIGHWVSAYLFVSFLLFFVCFSLFSLCGSDWSFFEFCWFLWIHGFPPLLSPIYQWAHPATLKSQLLYFS